MKFNAHEKAVLSVLAKLISSATDNEQGTVKKDGKSAARTFKPAEKRVLNKPKVSKRVRRSAADAEKLRKQVLAARKNKVPVAEIAKQNKITTAYIYQLLTRG